MNVPKFLSQVPKNLCARTIILLCSLNIISTYCVLSFCYSKRPATLTAGKPATLIEGKPSKLNGGQALQAKRRAGPPH